MKKELAQKCSYNMWWYNGLDSGWNLKREYQEMKKLHQNWMRWKHVRDITFSTCQSSQTQGSICNLTGNELASVSYISQFLPPYLD